MTEESLTDKSLVFLLVLAVVVSFGSIYLFSGNNQITGLYTATNATGIVSFTQQGVLSVTLTDALTTFGNITSTSTGVCRVNTEGVSNNCTATQTNDKMQLKNDGNVAAVVKVNSTKDLANGTSAAFDLGTYGDFRIKAANSLGGSCGSGLLSTYTTVPNASGTLLTLCSSLNYANTQNLLDLHYELVIGTDLAPGNQTVNVTFWASTT